MQALHTSVTFHLGVGRVQQGGLHHSPQRLVMAMLPESSEAQRWCTNAAIVMSVSATWLNPATLCTGAALL